MTVNGNCTLREAIQAANTDAVDACATGSGADTITLGAGAGYALTGWPSPVVDQPGD